MSPNEPLHPTGRDAALCAASRPAVSGTAFGGRGSCQEGLGGMGRDQLGHFMLPFDLMLQPPALVNGFLHRAKQSLPPR